MSDRRPQVRRLAAPWFVFLLLVSLLAIAVQPNRARADDPPYVRTDFDKGVLVVSNNVFESANPDAQDPQDMYDFADRVLELTPSLPDIVLLEEVRKSGVNAVKKRLNELAPDDEGNYVAAVPAPKNPWKHVSDTKLIGTDTAILANQITMTWDNTGHITHQYALAQSSPGDPVRWKRTAYAFMHKHSYEVADRTIDLPVAALHYPKWREFKSNATSCELKGKWTLQILNKLDEFDTPDPEFKVFGGDSNNFKNMTSLGCAENPTQMYANAFDRGYQDAVIAFKPTMNPIDYLFTTGPVAEAAQDEDFHPTPGDPGPHALRWALIEVTDTTPPTVPDPIDDGTAFPKKIQFQGFGGSLDGGSGFRTYVIYRKLDGTNDPFREIAPLFRSPITGHNYEDLFTDSQVGSTYLYYVTARDVVGNESEPPNVASCSPGPANPDPPPECTFVPW